MKKLSIVLILCLLWMGYIFYNSSLTSKESGKQSNTIISTIKSEKLTFESIADKFVNEELQNKVRSFYNKFKGSINTIVRKSAHAIEFCILSILISLLFSSLEVRLLNRVIYTLFIVLLWATLDEFHQLFVQGRGSSVKDILIDFLGGIVGVLVFNSISYVVGKIKNRNKQTRAVITRG